MKFIITIDTEADNQWKKESEVSLKNIAFLRRFQELCKQYNFKPTYLVTYEVAADIKAVEILKPWQDAGQAEIGAHLHPWTNPPYTKDINWERKVHRYLPELSNQELWDKITALTEIIKKNFDQAPKSFRAGRWGIDGRVIKNLSKLGYLADCSITPKVSWQRIKGDPKKSGGPDYRLASVNPYYVSTKDVMKVGDSWILEVPMTILFTGLLNKENSMFAKKYLLMPDSFIRKVINRLFFRQKWLRIFSGSTLRDWRRIFQSAQKNNLDVLEFMIHSSELMPGESQIVKTEEDLELIYKKINDMFSYFQKQDLEGILLREYADNFTLLPSASPTTNGAPRSRTAQRGRHPNNALRSRRRW